MIDLDIEDTSKNEYYKGWTIKFIKGWLWYSNYKINSNQREQMMSFIDCLNYIVKESSLKDLKFTRKVLQLVEVIN